MQFDKPIEELRADLPPRDEPADFDAFWARTLAEVCSHPLSLELEPARAGLATLQASDLTFSGFAGQPIKGWVIAPRDPQQSPFVRDGRLPCVVEYVGYGGGRGRPTDWLLFASAGYVHVVMDTRGQGSAWRSGDTPDQTGQDTTGQYPGFLTRGILDPETYYYRRLISDSVRAVEAARVCPLVDPSQVIVCGGSQGGGLTLAVAGLVPDLLLAMPDRPFMCHWRRATTITDSDPYQEIVRFARVRRTQEDRVFGTLAYFDGVNFAARASAPALFSVGLMDPITPPSTVFAAYNHYAGPKEIEVYPFSGHEAGETGLAELRLLRLAQSCR
jgi:cephalosporin-C deacetylase